MIGKCTRQRKNRDTVTAMAFNYDLSAVSPSGGVAVSPSPRDGIEMVPLNKYENSGSPGVAPGHQLTPRTPRRILSQGGGSSANQTPKKIQFTTPECHTVPPSPSMGSPKIILTNRKR